MDIAPRGDGLPARKLAGSCLLLLVTLSAGTGCYAPMHTYGVTACSLPDEYRTPRRTAGPPLNLSLLTLPVQGDYILGPDDVLDITISSLYPGAEVKPVRVRVMANGEVYLPMVGAVKIGGMNLVEANKAITDSYANGFIRDPRTNVTLAEKSTTNVVVLGEVKTPGVQQLPKYQNDIAHAIASAGGFAEDAADEIEVHRRIPRPNHVSLIGVSTPAPDEKSSENPVKVVTVEPAGAEEQVLLVDYSTESATESVAEEPVAAAEVTFEPNPVTIKQPEKPALLAIDQGVQQVAKVDDSGMEILHIPLRGAQTHTLTIEDVRLMDGDVVVIPSRKAEVFYVVGKLSPTNFVRFSIGARERDLGAGFLLPKDREIDVVTAVAMAGYIDPIDSPTTVSVQRTGPDGQPMLILVDLIKARYDRRETVLIEAGDIVYLNPDCPWYFRRTVDQLISNINPFSFGISYRIPTGGSSRRGTSGP